MTARGATDLDAMLADLSVVRRPGAFAWVVVEETTAAVLAVARAVVREEQGTTVVLAVEDAERLGLDVEFVSAWLTLAVQSSLEAVGLTAAFSRVLADAGIACNVVAGVHHDHLLVPVDRVDDAVAAIERLRGA